MNELKEILAGVVGDGISDERLVEIRQTWKVLGDVLDSAESDGGLSGDSFRRAQAYLTRANAKK